jgi:hypothetical protein
MLWLGLGVAFLVAIVLVTLFVRRPAADLGSVSPQWVAEHRAEP